MRVHIGPTDRFIMKTWPILPRTHRTWNEITLHRCWYRRAQNASPVSVRWAWVWRNATKGKKKMLLYGRHQTRRRRDFQQKVRKKYLSSTGSSSSPVARATVGLGATTITMNITFPRSLKCGLKLAWKDFDVVNNNGSKYVKYGHITALIRKMEIISGIEPRKYLVLFSNDQWYVAPPRSTSFF